MSSGSAFGSTSPGVTLDPTKVANDFFNAGNDIVISGIDTTEALVVAGQRAKKGEKVWAISYDYKDGCKGSRRRLPGRPRTLTGVRAI
jgi:simple sugar transport system substrate-binding protein